MTFTELLDQNKDIRHDDIVGPNVGCSIKAMLIINQTTIAFLFAPYHCCDMTRIIAFAQFMLPDVNTVLTFSGNELDTSYLLNKNNCWKGICLN